MGRERFLHNGMFTITVAEEHKVRHPHMRVHTQTLNRHVVFRHPHVRVHTQTLNKHVVFFLTQLLPETKQQ